GRRRYGRRRRGRAPGPCGAGAASRPLPPHGQAPPRFLARACQCAARPYDVQHDGGERDRIRGPHEGGIAAHLEKLLHAFTISRIQLAERSRLKTSPRRRTSSTAPKNSVKPSSIISSGTSIDAAMVGLASRITEGAWWSEFHQVTE